MGGIKFFFFLVNGETQGRSRGERKTVAADKGVWGGEQQVNPSPGLDDVMDQKIFKMFL